MKNALILSSLFFSFFYFSGTASALTVANSGFETGDLSGWSYAGDVSAEAADTGDIPRDGFGNAFDPSGNPVDPGSTEFIGDGNFLAMLTTGISLDRQEPASPSVIESFLGLPPGTLLAQGNGVPTSGSAMKQTFTANAGDTFSFDWYFITDRDPGSVSNNDFAFAVLNGGVTELADTNTTPLFQTFLLELGTGFQTASFMLSSAGNYTIGFGIVEVGGGDTSVLLIDNAGTGASSTVVPEPATSLLLFLGIAVSSISFTSRRRAKKPAR